MVKERGRGKRERERGENECDGSSEGLAAESAIVAEQQR